MTFETVDWEAEAIRIEKAFEGVAREDERFCEEDDEFTRRLVVRRDGYLFSCEICKYDGIHFQCMGEGGIEYWNDIAEVQFLWNGDIDVIMSHNLYGRPLAKALFRLGLLSAEIESSISITSHEKIDWASEL